MSPGQPIPLAGDGSGRFLPWVVALMVFLAAVVTAASFAVGATLERWDAGLGGTLTVQLPVPPDRALPPDRLAAALAALRSTPGVVRADALDDRATGKLLQPWLGPSVDPALLHLPILVDVRLAQGAEPDRAVLEQRLAAIVPGATVARRGAWLDRLFEVARLVEIGLAGAVLLVGAVAVAAVVFTTRTGLALHAEIISLLHLIGATDRYVARQFQWHAFRLALGGGVMGLVMAFLGFGALRMAFEHGAIGTGPVPIAGGLPLTAWAVIAALPLVTALVGLVTARITVLRTLARMP